MKKLLLTACCIAIFNTACEKKEILPGKRESIEGLNDNLFETNVKEFSSDIVSTTQSEVLQRHVCINGNKSHTAINHKMPLESKILWKCSIGGYRTNCEPIVIDDCLYIVNSKGELKCISISNKSEKWSIAVAKQPDDTVYSGGLTAEGSTIYVTTNTGDVLAIDSQEKKIIWKKSIKHPLRNAPLYINDKLLVLSVTGHVFALNSSNGNLIWEKETEGECTILNKSSTPVVVGETIICAYTSGDVKSYEINSGHERWNEILTTTNISESGAAITQIVASPVVTNGNVLITNSESSMVMLDATTGEKVWENDIYSINTPLVNNGWIYVITPSDNVVCLSSKDGKVKWVTELQDINKKKSRIDVEYNGILLINGKIWIFSNLGNIIKIDPKNGKIIKIETIDGLNTEVNPIVVNNKIFVVNSKAEIYAIG